MCGVEGGGGGNQKWILPWEIYFLRQPMRWYSWVVHQSDPRYPGCQWIQCVSNWCLHYYILPTKKKKNKIQQCDNSTDLQKKLNNLILKLFIGTFKSFVGVGLPCGKKNICYQVCMCAKVLAHIQLVRKNFLVLGFLR